MEKTLDIIITGASGGIGTNLVDFFSSKGYNVFAMYNKHKPEFSNEITTFQADLTDYTQVKSAIKAYFSKKPSLDVLINSHAASYDAFISSMGSEKFMEVINTNLTGTFNIVKEVLPYMQKQGYGNIINIGSIVGETGGLGCSAYSASKAAIHNFTKSIARENARYNIISNTLELGYFNVGLGLRIPKNVREKIELSVPLKKFGEVDQILHAVNFLVENPYMTGSELKLTGGL